MLNIFFPHAIAPALAENCVLSYLTIKINHKLKNVTKQFDLLHASDEIIKKSS